MLGLKPVTVALFLMTRSNILLCGKDKVLPHKHGHKNYRVSCSELYCARNVRTFQRTILLPIACLVVNNELQRICQETAVT